MTTETQQSLFTPEVRSFLSHPLRYATIATINADGSPHEIVIWYTLRGDEIVVNSRRGRRWPSNLLRDGRANLAVYEGEDEMLGARVAVAVLNPKGARSPRALEHFQDEARKLATVATRTSCAGSPSTVPPTA